jgi:hypothetical protein
MTSDDERDPAYSVMMAEGMTRTPAGTPGTIESNGAALCLADFGGYGACVQPAGHSGQHSDANGYVFTAEPHGATGTRLPAEVTALLARYDREVRAAEAEPGIHPAGAPGATDAEVAGQLAGLIETARLAATASMRGPIKCGACHACRTPGRLDPDEMCDVIDADRQLSYARLSADLAADNTRALSLAAADAIEAARESGDAAIEATEALHFAREAAETARTAGGVALTATGYVPFPAPASGRHASA